MNDRLDTGLTTLATAITTSDLKDEDDMASNSATHAATQQSIKAYADTKATIGIVIALGG